MAKQVTREMISRFYYLGFCLCGQSNFFALELLLANCLFYTLQQLNSYVTLYRS